MRAVVQRSGSASVVVDEVTIGSIESGLVILLGIEHEDTQNDANWLIRKIQNMRIFNDEKGVMNESIKDQKREFLVISQFTLHASTKKGNRPSYTRSAAPDIAEKLYNYFVDELRNQTDLVVETGKFGAMMDVSLTNKGPVTILLDSKNPE